MLAVAANHLADLFVRNFVFKFHRHRECMLVFVIFAGDVVQQDANAFLRPIR